MHVKTLTLAEILWDVRNRNAVLMIINTNLFLSNSYLLNLIYNTVCLAVLVNRAILVYKYQIMTEIGFPSVMAFFVM